MEKAPITGVFPRGKKFVIIFQGDVMNTLEFDDRDTAWKTLIRFQYLMSRQGELLEQIQKNALCRPDAASTP